MPASLCSDGVHLRPGMVFGFPPECCSAWPESPAVFGSIELLGNELAIAALNMPVQVMARQDANVRWGSVPETEDVRVVVRAVGDFTDFIQGCRAQGHTRG